MEDFGVLLPLEEEQEEYEPRYLDVRYDSDGTLGLQFHAESDPPFAVARITPGSLTADHPLAVAGMVLVSIAGREVAPDADYGEALNQLRRMTRPLELRFRLPDVQADEGNHPDGPVEHEGVLRKLERDTSFHRGYTPHPRFFVLRADGLEYFRLFLAGVHGMGDTVTSGTGRTLPFGDMQAVVPGSDLPPELINDAPSAELGADSPHEATWQPHWAVEDDGSPEDGSGAGSGAGHAVADDPFAQTFALSAPLERSLNSSLQPEPELGSTRLNNDGTESVVRDPESAKVGDECRFTIVMGDSFVGSGGYRKPWRLYRLEAASASDREAWLGCIRGGMARYREHGPWALRPRVQDRAAAGPATTMAGAWRGWHVVSATVARTLVQDATNRAPDGGSVAGSSNGTPRAVGAGPDDGVPAGSTTPSILSFWPRPYTRYIIEYRTEANVHGEVARRFGEFRQLHSQVLGPISSPAAPLVMPHAHQATDVLADKNDPELAAYRASELQQYISSAVRLVTRLNAPLVRYALDHFLTDQSAGPHLEQLGGSKAVADLLSRQQLWDAVGHWRGEESGGLLGVTTTDATGTVTGRRASAWFGLNLDPDGSAEMTIAHEGTLLAQLLGRWECCGGGRRLRLSFSSTVTSGANRAARDGVSKGSSKGDAASMSRCSGVRSYNSWRLELTWRKVCVENAGRSADTSREYTLYHIACVQSRVAEDTGHTSSNGSLKHAGVTASEGAAAFDRAHRLVSEPEPEPERRWIVSARYSVFASLRDLLLGSGDRRLSADIAAVDELFPPKEGAASWIMPRSSTLDADRQAGLLGWLQAVHRVAPRHPAVLAFLAPPQTKSNIALGDDPVGPYESYNLDAGALRRGHHHTHSMGTSLPTSSSLSGRECSIPSMSSAGTSTAGAVPAARGLRGRGSSDEFVMPDGDHDVYSDYPDYSADTGSGESPSRGLSRTISNLGIQGLSTPRAAEAVKAGAAAAAVVAASPTTDSLRGIIGGGENCSRTGAVSAGLVTAAPTSMATVQDTPVQKLTLASAGSPTVHNVGVAWSDSFGNAVERRRLVLETCMRSDGENPAERGGAGSESEPEDCTAWQSYSEAEVRPTISLFT